jgi:hypothetical protein
VIDTALSVFFVLAFLSILGSVGLDLLGKADPLLAFTRGVDAHTYWSTAHPETLYPTTPTLYRPDDYFYSPLFAQLLYLPAQLPFPIFRILMAGVACLVYAWLLAASRRRDLVPLTSVAAFAVIVGNIEWLYCLVIVVGFRYPGAWMAMMLTKVTPTIGVAWFAARIDVRAFAQFLAFSAHAVVVSFLWAPILWSDWFRVLQYSAAHHSSAGLLALPLIVRLCLGTALAALAARTSSRFLLPFAILFSQPDINPSTLAIVCAIPRLRVADAQ